MMSAPGRRRADALDVIDPASAALDRLVIDDHAAGLFRVAPEAFTDPALFELEQARVFRRCWIYAAHTSELDAPGAFVARRVAGRDLILTRAPDGDLHALINACRHRGARVCHAERGQARAFTCPYHGWTYDPTGRLIGLPGDDAYADSAFDRADVGLARVPHVATHRGFVFVNFAADADPLVDFLAGAKACLDLIADQAPDGLEVLPGSHRYAIRANWKLVAENGIDSYHFRTLHRRYLSFVRTQGEAGPPGDFAPKGWDFGHGHGADEHQNLAALGRLSGRWGPLFPAALAPEIAANRARLEALYGAERAYRITHVNRSLRLFPNLYVLDNSNTTIRTFYPTAVDAVEVTEWALGARGESDALRAARLRSHSGLPGPASFVSPDDVAVLEACQRGLAHAELPWIDCSRGMKRAEPLPTDELQHRGFYRHWHTLLTGGRIRYPKDAP